MSDLTAQIPSSPAKTTNEPSLTLLLAQEIEAAMARLKGHRVTSLGEAASGSYVAAMENLRRWCDTYLTVAKDPGDQYLLFFLAVFFHDVFFNLVGDVPYTSEVEGCRQEFFRAFVRELETLATSLRGRDWNRRTDALQNLVSSYLGTIARLNELDSSIGGANDTK